MVTMFHDPTTLTNFVWLIQNLFHWLMHLQISLTIYRRCYTFNIPVVTPNKNNQLMNSPGMCLYSYAKAKILAPCKLHAMVCSCHYSSEVRSYILLDISLSFFLALQIKYIYIYTQTHIYIDTYKHTNI